MTKALLAVVAVLLAVNAVGSLPSQQAKAQPVLNPPPPRVIQVVQTESVGVIFRLWSDGIIETTGYGGSGDLCDPDWCPWELVPDDVPPQPEARIVQIAANWVASHATLVRVWSNGVVERNYSTWLGGGDNWCIPSEEWCGWQAMPE